MAKVVLVDWMMTCDHSSSGGLDHLFGGLVRSHFTVKNPHVLKKCYRNLNGKCLWGKALIYTTSPSSLT